MRQAYEDGFITNSKLLKVKAFEERKTQREYLTFDDVQDLASTESKYNILKKAFLFSCLTGLRWSDIHKLSWNEVRDENNEFKIIYTQQKTSSLEYLLVVKLARF